MKKLFKTLLGLGFFSLSQAAPSQVEFVARIQAIETTPGGANLTLNLTPSHAILVRATDSTEIRDQADLPISLATLAPEMLVKVEGIFISGGILALQIEVTASPQQFEIRGEIEALTQEGPNRRLEVLGFSILATPATEVEDAFGNPLFLTELAVGQRVKVEGNAGVDDLLAREIKLIPEDDGFARIRVTGVVTGIAPDHILLAIIGGATARVEIGDATEIRGDLVIGARVDVVGRLNAALAIQADRVLVQGLFLLLPDEIHLEPEGQGRVEIVLSEAHSEDLTFVLSSRNAAVAAPLTDEAMLPAGSLSTFFEVGAGPGEARTEIRVEAPGLGNASRLLEVEVESPDSSNDDDPGDDGGNDDNPGDDNPGDEAELELKWKPRKLFNPNPGPVDVELLLNQPAPADLTIQLFLKDGNPDLVSFPMSVSVPAGADRVAFMIEVFPGSGEVKIRAALPDGGDTDDLEIELAPPASQTIKLEWDPDEVEAAPGTLVDLSLRLDQAATAPFKVIVNLKSGDPALVPGMPSEIEFVAGQQIASFQVQLGSGEGRVEFTAAVPFELGGDTETIRFEIAN